MDPDAVIAHDNVCFRRYALDANVDAATGRSELDRIGQEVPYDLLQACRIARHRTDPTIDLRVDRDALRLCGRLNRVDGSVHDRRQIRPSHLQGELSGHDAAHVQQVCDELGLNAG